MKHSLAFVVAAMLVIAPGGGVFAQGVPTPGAAKAASSPETISERLDGDGDGKVSREEFRGPPGSTSSTATRTAF